MKVILKEKPKGVTIIQGFPGFGMVGSISTEFLIEHLNTRLIGTVQLHELEPVIAIHDGKLIPPIGIYYAPEHNLIILNFLTKGSDLEWDLAKAITEISLTFEAKEIIALEGVAYQHSEGGKVEQKIICFAKSEEKRKEFSEKGFELMKEGIVMGVSAALLLQKDSLKCELSTFFSMTASTLPDSNAAAEIIKTLDKYLGLEVDFEPLHDQARKFEEKIKGLLTKSKNAKTEKEKSMLNYFS